MRGRIGTLGLADTPPHPAAFAKASAADLSPRAGRGERMERRVNKPRKRVEAAE